MLLPSRFSGPSGVATTVSMNTRKSFLPAAAISTPIGMPSSSTSRLRFVPPLERSTGLGPVASPPSGALVIEPSMLSHSSLRPFTRSYSNRPSSQKRRNTPAASHSWKRLCAVAPLQIPVASRALHWQPVIRTNRMPFITARSGTLLRWQPNGCTSPGSGIRGSISAHRASDRGSKQRASPLLRDTLVLVTSVLPFYRLLVARPPDASTSRGHFLALMYPIQG